MARKPLIINAVQIETAEVGSGLKLRVEVVMRLKSIGQAMRETKCGRGKLRAWPPAQGEWEVDYEIDFDTELLQASAIPDAVSKTTPTVRFIRPIDGSSVPQGDYELKTKAGETIPLIYRLGMWLVRVLG
jgi:hypothetical protein